MSKRFIVFLLWKQYIILADIPLNNIAEYGNDIPVLIGNTCKFVLFANIYVSKKPIAPIFPRSFLFPFSLVAFFLGCLFIPLFQNLQNLLCYRYFFLIHLFQQFRCLHLFQCSHCCHLLFPRYRLYLRLLFHQGLHLIQNLQPCARVNYALRA